MKVRALPSLPSRTAHCLFPLPVYTSTRGIPNPERLGTRLPFSSFTLIERRLLSIDGARFVLGGTARVGAAVEISGLSFDATHLNNQRALTTTVYACTCSRRTNASFYCTRRSQNLNRTAYSWLYERVLLMWHGSGLSRAPMFTETN